MYGPVSWLSTAFDFAIFLNADASKESNICYQEVLCSQPGGVTLPVQVFRSSGWCPPQ